jgi:hypothetical protein
MPYLLRKPNNKKKNIMNLKYFFSNVSERNSSNRILNSNKLMNNFNGFFVYQMHFYQKNLTLVVFKSEFKFEFIFSLFKNCF